MEGKPQAQVWWVFPLVCYLVWIHLWLMQVLGCVLDGMLGEDQLQVLAECYGLDKDADLRFTEYRFP